MTAATSLADADRPAVRATSRSQRDADLTVRIANLVPSTATLIEVEVRALLKAHRIGGIVRVGVPLDEPRDRDGKRLNVPRELWTATRAFVAFNRVERAERATAAFDGLAHSGSILIARRQGNGARTAPVTSPAAAPTPDTDLQPRDFPELSDTVEQPTTVEEAQGPKPPPHPVVTMPPAASEDAASIRSVSELSTATTSIARCKYCKAVGHLARANGAICCPVLFAKVEREEAADAEDRMAKAFERAVTRKQRKHEDELSGWTRVGKQLND